MQQEITPVTYPADVEDLATAQYRMKHPVTGKPTTWVLTLAGPEHPERKKRLWEAQRRTRAAIRATNEMPVSDPAEDEQSETEFVVANVLHWDGGPEPYSPEACQRRFSHPRRRHEVLQVGDALRRREVFIGVSASS